MSFKIRRVVAYIFDALAVSLIASAISMSGLNPNIVKIENLQEEVSVKASEYREAISDISDASGFENEIKYRTEEFNEYYEESLYEVSKLSWFLNCTSLIVIVAYFGVFAYFFNGETVGKRLFKIKIVSKEDSKVSFVKLFFRTIILYGLPLTVIELVCSQTLGMEHFLIVYNLLYYLSFALEIALISTTLLRKDGRGLHDIIAGTKVIDVKEN